MGDWTSIIIQIGLLVAALASGIGLNQLWANRQKRGFDQEDKQEKRSEERAAAQIASDDRQHDRDEARIEKLEANLVTLQESFNAKILEFAEIKTDLKLVQQSLTSQMKESQNIESQNAALKKDNIRLEKEITQLQSDNRALRVELDALKAIVTANGLKFEVAQSDDPLKVEIVKGTDAAAK